MKVSELKKLLEGFNEDANVYIETKGRKPKETKKAFLYMPMTPGPTDILLSDSDKDTK